MTAETIQAAATQAVEAVRAELPAASALLIAVRDDAPRHPRFPDVLARYAHWAGDVLEIHGGAFEALATAHPTLVLEDLVERFTSMRLEDEVRGRETIEAAPDEDGLLAWHARFRAGEPLPYAWYRAGAEVDHRTWAVDLDVFAEVWLPATDWADLVGKPIALALGDDRLDLAFPDDAEPGEWITLEGAGLFDDELYDDEPVPASGDLHLLFFVV